MEEHFLEAHSLSLVASEDDQEDHLMMVVEVLEEEVVPTYLEEVQTSQVEQVVLHLEQMMMEGEEVVEVE